MIILRFSTCARKLCRRALSTLRHGTWTSAVFVGIAGASAPAVAQVQILKPAGLPIAGTATDPAAWSAPRGTEFLGQVNALREVAAQKASGIVGAHKRVRAAMEDVRRNPGSEAHKHAMLETAIEAIGVVQSAVLEVRRHEAALDAAYLADMQRLRTEQERRDRAAEASAGEERETAAELERVRARIAELMRAGAGDEELDDVYFKELELSDRLASYEGVRRNHGFSCQLPARSLQRLRAARRTCKEALIRFGGYSDRLVGATQTLEVVAEAMDSQKVADALADLSDVTRNLVGDGSFESTMQQVVTLLAQADVQQGESRTAARTTSFDDWKKNWQKKLATDPSGAGKGAEVAGGGR